MAAGMSFNKVVDQRGPVQQNKVVQQPTKLDANRIEARVHQLQTFQDTYTADLAKVRDIIPSKQISALLNLIQQEPAALAKAPEQAAEVLSMVSDDLVATVAQAPDDDSPQGKQAIITDAIESANTVLKNIVTKLEALQEEIIVAKAVDTALLTEETASFDVGRFVEKVIEQNTASVASTKIEALRGHLTDTIGSLKILEGDLDAKAAPAKTDAEQRVNTALAAVQEPEVVAHDAPDTQAAVNAFAETIKASIKEAVVANTAVVTKEKQAPLSDALALIQAENPLPETLSLVGTSVEKVQITKLELANTRVTEAEAVLVATSQKISGQEEALATYTQVAEFVKGADVTDGVIHDLVTSKAAQLSIILEATFGDVLMPANKKPQAEADAALTLQFPGLKQSDVVEILGKADAAELRAALPEIAMGGPISGSNAESVIKVIGQLTAVSVAALKVQNQEKTQQLAELKATIAVAEPGEAAVNAVLTSSVLGEIHTAANALPATGITATTE